MTGTEIVAFVKKAKDEKWGYVLGGNGELYTEEVAENWAKTRNKPNSWSGTKAGYFVVACARWFNHRVADCSGMIVAAFRSQNKAYQDQKADTFYARCTEKGPIKTIPEIPGLCVWKKGHIGVYIGNGYAIESRGYKYGVVMTKVKDRPWTNWGKLRDAMYAETSIAFALGRLLKWRGKPYMEGSDVKAVQTKLTEIKYSPGGIDGQYGPKTEKAVKAFQKANGLVADGIVGPKTITALGGVWIN